MKKIIDNLKKQPVEHRKNVLHLVTFFFAIIMVFLWVFSLGKNLSKGETQEKIKNDLQPINVLKDNLVDGYKSINVSNNAKQNLEIQDISIDGSDRVIDISPDNSFSPEENTTNPEDLIVEELQEETIQ
jgi:hypothetical protein